MQVLRDYTHFFNASLTSETQKPLTLRITGGWVRDKLLGRPSHDIDVGIDHQSGETFVQGLKSWLELGNADGATIAKIHKIKMNPSKSKHLETCTINLLGLDIDFVNLRSETYSDQSRIPVIEAGTPSQDAHRRDATLNSLFYNLESLQVEDLTGKGLEDLEHGILRTPLEPRRTFLDDPLRCLRLIRFASTYGFSVDPVALEAMSQEDIKVALNTKISRERIGVELKKVLMGGDVLMGFKLLSKVGFGSIWGVGDAPLSKEWIAEYAEQGNTASVQAMRDVVEYLPAIVQGATGPLREKLDSLLDRKNLDDLERVSFWSTLVLHFWGQQKARAEGKKGKEAYVAFWCTLNGIRMPMKVSELVSLMVKDHRAFVERLDVEYTNLDAIQRSQMAHQYVIPYQAHWELNLATNYVLEGLVAHGSVVALNQKYNTLLAKITQLGIAQSYQEPLLINGKEIVAKLNRKPGPWLKPLNDKLFTWQLDHPHSTKAQMEDHLLAIVENI